MAWLSIESEKKFLEGIIENSKELKNKKVEFRPGFQVINVGDRKVLLKQAPSDGRDNFENEFAIGTLLNRLRDKSPNFVFTYGSEKGKRGKHILLEYVPGFTLGSYRGQFKKLLGYVLQTLFAVKYAYDELGFTHHNLHRQNVILKKLPRVMRIPYFVDGEIVFFDTDRIPVIIDFGRSYTHETGGHSLPSKGVYPKANYFRDFYYFLHSSLRRIYPQELEILLNWYGLPLSSNPCLEANLLNPKLRSGKKLLQMCRKVFGYRPLRRRPAKIILPI